jgi:hypothetical protein
MFTLYNHFVVLSIECRIIVATLIRIAGKNPISLVLNNPIVLTVAIAILSIISWCHLIKKAARFNESLNHFIGFINADG